MLFDPLLAAAPQEQENPSVPTFRPGRQENEPRPVPPGNQNNNADDPAPATSGAPEDLDANESTQDGPAVPSEDSGPAGTASGETESGSPQQETTEQETTTTVQVPAPAAAAEAEAINPMYYFLLAPFLIPLLILVIWFARKRRFPSPETTKTMNARFKQKADEGNFRAKVTPDILRSQGSSTSTGQPNWNRSTAKRR